jgi:hypothetical protein
MNLSISGLPAIAIAVGFIVVFSLPVWLASRVVGAASPTLIRSAMSLFVGAIGSVISIAIGGGATLLLAPLSFLLSFKFVLGTSVIGSVVLAVLSLAGYAAMVHLIGGGINFSAGAPGA